MLQTKRGASLLGAVAFLLTIVYLYRSYERPTSVRAWRAKLKPTPPPPPTAPYLDDEGHEWNDTYYENPHFKSSRPGPWAVKQGPFLDNHSDELFPPGTPKPHNSNYTRALVIAKTKSEDTSWTDDPALSTFSKFLYVVDNPYAPLSVPENKGHEVMVYLTYIITTYNTLPDISIFMHAHRHAWHQNDLLQNDAIEMAWRLSAERVTRLGYMNLRCHWVPGCPDWMHPGTLEEDANKQEETVLAQAWAELFPSEAIPTVLAQPCCSQFALSAERIRQIPLEKYEYWREWIIRTPLEDKISGRVWEYLWQVIFTGHNVVCPNQWGCYCDGYGVCFENEKEFDYWFELRWRRHVLDEDLKKWREKATKMEEYREQGRLVAEKDIPKHGRDIEILTEMDKLERTMDDARLKALERGTNASFRAYSVGRKWEPGSGY